MTCDCIESGKPLERNGHTGTCNRLTRKQLAAENKPIKATKPIAKVGKSNTFECSDGTRVTQTDIVFMRRAAYDLMDAENHGVPICEGCGKGTFMEGTHAHIIPQARCKDIGKTDLIWERKNLFRGCFDCNSAIESPKGHAWKSLKNAQKCLDFIKIHDSELYQKFMVNSAGFNDKHAI
jgi:hypothetical protein